VGTSLRVHAFTAAALVGFAANSLLCRQALGGKSIDPFGFTYVRLASGAVTLWLVARMLGAGADEPTPPKRSWLDALWLASYALPFSIAYTRLDAGTGALLLFGAVQLTLVVWALRAGERPTVVEGMGFLGAGAGLVYLVSPGLSAPDPWGAMWMGIAGVSWGLYTVAGKRGGDPTRRTARNFARATLLMVPVALATYARLHAKPEGLLLAIASGAVASGLGYAAWYVAMRELTATRAALLQLGVPILAAAGGIVLLSEAFTARLGLASAVVLGSLALAIGGRSRR
jgi:drug/metabolite transporter (DMT)-like permease